MKRSLLTAAALSLVAFWIADLLSGTVVEAGANALSNLWGTLVSLPAYVASGHPLATDAISLSIGFAVFCLVWVAWAKWRERAGKYRRGEEHGSSRWATRAPRVGRSTRQSISSISRARARPCPSWWRISNSPMRRRRSGF